MAVVNANAVHPRLVPTRPPVLRQGHVGRGYPHCWRGGQVVGAGGFLGRGNELRLAPGSGLAAQLAALEEASLLICWFVWGVMPGTCCNASLAGAVSPVRVLMLGFP